MLGQSLHPHWQDGRHVNNLDRASVAPALGTAEQKTFHKVVFFVSSLEDNAVIPSGYGSSSLSLFHLKIQSYSLLRIEVNTDVIIYEKGKRTEAADTLCSANFSECLCFETIQIKS